MKRDNPSPRCTKSSRRRWIAGLGGLALVTGLFIWLRRHTDRATIQRRFWDVVYDRLALLYDGVDWCTGNTTHRLRRRALPYLPPEGNRVLEIGFGSGKLHVELAERYALAGLDRAPGMAQLTQRRLASRGLTSELHVGDVTTLPWEDTTFDAVLLTFAFSAFPDAHAALAEMTRVLKPGGKLIIVDAGEALDGNAMARFLAQLWSTLGDYMRNEVPLMEAHGLTATREDYGPWNCVHVTVGTKPA